MIFTFQLRDEETNKKYSFKFEAPNEEAVEDFFDRDIYFLINEKKLEETYGVLDFESTGRTWGYHSYEIPEEKYEKVLKTFKSFFVEKGFLTH